MVWSEGVAPLVLFEKGTLDHHQGSTACCSTIQKQLDLPTRQRNSTYARIVFLDKDTWPANSPDLNPLDDCIWDEFAQAINCDKVTWKSSLIVELKRDVKKKFVWIL